MIIGFIGDMGSGKTLSMIRHAVSDYNKGFKIYSNVQLKLIKYEILDMKKLIEYAEGRVNLDKVTILLDEAHIFLDSRTSMLKRNRILSYLLLQSRKAGFNLYYTTQYTHQIDKRLRSVTEVAVTCLTKTFRKEKYTLNKLTKFSSVTGIKTQNIVFKSSDYYKYYDTRQIIHFSESE
jgi:hypothetical protein